MTISRELTEKETKEIKSYGLSPKVEEAIRRTWQLAPEAKVKKTTKAWVTFFMPIMMILLITEIFYKEQLHGISNVAAGLIGILSLLSIIIFSLFAYSQLNTDINLQSPTLNQTAMGFWKRPNFFQRTYGFLLSFSVICLLFFNGHFIVGTLLSLSAISLRTIRYCVKNKVQKEINRIDGITA